MPALENVPELVFGCMYCYESMGNHLTIYLNNLRHLFFKARLVSFIFSILIYLFLEYYDKEILEALTKNKEKEEHMKYKILLLGLRGLSIGCFATIIVTQFMSLSFNQDLKTDLMFGTGFGSGINGTLNETVYNISAFIGN